MLRGEMVGTVSFGFVVHRCPLLADGVSLRMKGAAQWSKDVSLDETKQNTVVGDQLGTNWSPRKVEG